MKKLLNTLYITTQDSFVRKQRETIVIEQGGDRLAQFPALTIGNILCFGRVNVSPFLMGYCGEKGIGISFYTEFGKFLARIQGAQTGNVLLRRTQYRWADNEEKSMSIARVIIASKIKNTRSVLMRELRNYGDNGGLGEAVRQLAGNIRRVKHAQSVDQLMGVEGDAANTYFSVFPMLIRSPGFDFNGRNRRPPMDPVNAMLSFAYTLVTSECASALQGAGLDPYVGYLHQDRPGRASLALDLLEELRSPWAERFVLTLINRKQIKNHDFIKDGSGAIKLRDDARKSVLTAWQERKRQEINHPYLHEKVPIGLLPHCQAMLLARHLRGDVEYYPPFIMK